jgi:hypothetical protein
MKQSPFLDFMSSAFPIEPGEDERTNPGIFGKALANWIAEQLRTQGTAVRTIIAEDFGWCIPIEPEPHKPERHKLYVACANTEDEQDHWSAFVFAEGGLQRRMFGKDNSDRAVETLYMMLKKILQRAPEIRDLRETAD